MSNDQNLPEHHRVGALDYAIIVRGEEGHKNNSKLDRPIYQQWQNAIAYPDASASNKVDSRKVLCIDFQKLCGLGMMWLKRDEVLALF